MISVYPNHCFIVCGLIFPGLNANLERLLRTVRTWMLTGINIRRNYTEMSVNLGSVGFDLETQTTNSFCTKAFLALSATYLDSVNDK